MNSTSYFPHDADAHNDPKIIELRISHGWEAYGLYWAIIEIMRSQKGYKLLYPFSQQLAYRLHISEDQVDMLVDRCMELNLFNDDVDGITSLALQRRMTRAERIRQKRSRAGKIGGKASGASRRNKPKEELKQENKPKQETPQKRTVKSDKKPKVTHKKNLDKQAAELYAIYPRKVGKGAAIKAILKALTQETFEYLVEATEEYANSVDGYPDMTKIPHPSTWYNQERYNDDRTEWKRWRLTAIPDKQRDTMDDMLDMARKEMKNEGEAFDADYGHE